MSGGCGLGFRPEPRVAAVKPGTAFVSSYTQREVDSWRVPTQYPSAEDFPFDKEFD